MESETGPEPGTEEPPHSAEPGSDITDSTGSMPFAPVDPGTLAGSTPPPYPTQDWPGYGQPPASPFGYPPYGYGSPQPPTGTNGMAIAALVLGLCGFLFLTPVVGLVLGFVALSAVKKSGQSGKGLAISGIVLSLVWIAVFATFITVSVVTAPPPAHRDANGNVVGQGAVSVFSLHPKDCFTVPAGMIGSPNSSIRSFTVVPCTTPHDSEAIGSFTASESSFPGVDALRAESTSQCVKVLGTYLLDAEGIPSGTLVQFVVPNEQAWVAGEHRVTCFVQFPTATVTQAVYRDASSFTPDQLRYINALHPVVNALTALNVTSRSAPLAEMEQRANDIADAEQTEIAALTAAPWPADVQPAIDAVVAKHREGSGRWAQAAGADDMTSFDDDMSQANGYFGLTEMKAARTALGLTTADLTS